MPSNESMAYDVALRGYEEQYKALKAQLQTLGFIGQGSVCTRRITCGRPACRCHDDPDARHGPYQPVEEVCSLNRPVQAAWR